MKKTGSKGREEGARMSKERRYQVTFTKGRIQTCPEPGVVSHTFNLSTWDAEADGSLRVERQPGLHSEF